MNVTKQIDLPESKWMEKLEKNILAHPAWHGHLNGMDCEDLLRGNPPLSYLLRAGEERFHYYLSFVLENPFSFKHQPFTLDVSSQGWFYRNSTPKCAFDLETLIGLIMHCEKDQILPVVKAPAMR